MLIFRFRFIIGIAGWKLRTANRTGVMLVMIPKERTHSFYPRNDTIRMEYMFAGKTHNGIVLCNIRFAHGADRLAFYSANLHEPAT